MTLSEGDQPISSPFFRAYSGSGLSIQRLARSQRTPSRTSVARIVSPLTCLSVLCLVLEADFGGVLQCPESVLLAEVPRQLRWVEDLP